MRLHGVTELVDTFDSGIAGRIETDGIVRAADIIVDRRRNADHRDPEPGKLKRAAEGTVAADRHDALQTKHLAGGDRLLASRFSHELLAARGIQDGTAPGQQVADALAGKLYEITIDEALPAAPDTDAFDPVGKGRSDHRADCRIHAGRVAAARQNTDSFDLFHFRTILSDRKSTRLNSSHSV